MKACADDRPLRTGAIRHTDRPSAPAQSWFVGELGALKKLGIVFLCYAKGV